MRIPLSLFRLAWGATALLGACARNPQPATPAPQAAPAPLAAPAPAPAPSPAAAVDLSGEWAFVANLGGQDMVGVIQLARSGSTYSGSATPANANGSAPLTSLIINGASVVMVFDTPQGEARAEATLEGGNVMKGTVQYAGYSGAFTARKH